MSIWEENGHGGRQKQEQRRESQRRARGRGYKESSTSTLKLCEYLFSPEVPRNHFRVWLETTDETGRLREVICRYNCVNL